MRLTKLPALATTLLSLSLVSACGDSRPASVSAFPPNADLRAATTPKPVPGPEIVTDDAARERYNVVVEAWGEALWRAGGRICRWSVENGNRVPFCPRPDADPTDPRPE